MVLVELAAPAARQSGHGDVVLDGEGHAVECRQRLSRAPACGAGFGRPAGTVGIDPGHRIDFDLHGLQALQLGFEDLQRRGRSVFIGYA